MGMDGGIKINNHNDPSREALTQSGHGSSLPPVKLSFRKLNCQFNSLGLTLWFLTVAGAYASSCQSPSVFNMLQRNLISRGSAISLA